MRDPECNCVGCEWVCLPSLSKQNGSKELPIVLLPHGSAHLNPPVMLAHSAAACGVTAMTALGKVQHGHDGSAAARPHVQFVYGAAVHAAADGAYWSWL